MSFDKNSILAFAVGAAVGGTVALLLAPDKGEVTRQRIRDGSARVIHKGTEAVDRAKAAAEGAGHTIGNAARQRAGAVGDAFAAAKETYVRESTRA
jgi:gas vesicle protein